MTVPFRSGLTTLLCVLIFSTSMACSQGAGGSGDANSVDVAASEAPELRTDDLSSLDVGWNTVIPGGETTCSDGSPYHFYVRPGDPRQLVFYLQGGGACWNAATCDPDGEPSYRINLAGFDPANRHGIFAFDHPENSFAKHTVVLAPYCTGDVHLGDRVATYEVEASEGHAAHSVTIRFQGIDNVQAALDWTTHHLSAPDAIFVTGSSAGSIPSPHYATRLAESYPEARIVQLGDGSGGYRGFGAVPPHVEWGTLAALSEIEEFQQMTPDDLDFEALFAVAEARQPEIMFAQYDTAEDDVQKRFLALADAETTSLLGLLQANQADIRAEVPKFRSFIAGGELHTILLRPEFYTYRVGDVRVRDWVTDLAAGKAVEDVHCEDCSVAEILK